MKRIILLTILALEGFGGILGGFFLAAGPDGHLMKMSVEVMHGFFTSFFIPGIILMGMGILNISAFIAVLRRSRVDWIMAGLALVGFAIWFGVEIMILREIHWLHIIWGTPVLVAIWIALNLTPWKKNYAIEKNK